MGVAVLYSQVQAAGRAALLHYTSVFWHGTCCCCCCVIHKAGVVKYGSTIVRLLAWGGGAVQAWLVGWGNRRVGTRGGGLGDEMASGRLMPSDDTQ